MNGAIAVDVTSLDQKADLSLLVVTGDGPSLMGWDWLSYIKLDWTMLQQMRADPFNDFEWMLD